MSREQNDVREPARKQFWQQRDPEGYRCPGCGRSRSAAGSFHVHHRDGNKHNHHPDNLIALCERCHLGDEHDLDVTPSQLEPAKPYDTGPAQPRNLQPDV